MDKGLLKRHDFLQVQKLINLYAHALAYKSKIAHQNERIKMFKQDSAYVEKIKESFQ